MTCPLPKGQREEECIKIRVIRAEKQKVIFSIEQRKTAKKETCPRKNQINYSPLDILFVNFFKKSH